MKRFMVSFVAIMLVAMAGATFAANTTEDVNVAATVQVKCTPVASGTMTFVIDPATVAPVIPSVLTQPHVQCSKFAPLAVTVASTNNVTSDNTGSFNSTLTHAGCAAIPYNFTYATAPSGAGFAAGAYVNFNVNGSIAVIDANAADYCSGNSYIDTVTMTLTF